MTFKCPRKKIQNLQLACKNTEIKKFHVKIIDKKTWMSIEWTWWLNYCLPSADWLRWTLQGGWHRLWGISCSLPLSASTGLWAVIWQWTTIELSMKEKGKWMKGVAVYFVIIRISRIIRKRETSLHFSQWLFQVPLKASLDLRLWSLYTFRIKNDIKSIKSTR